MPLYWKRKKLWFGLSVLFYKVSLFLFLQNIVFFFFNPFPWKYWMFETQRVLVKLCTNLDVPNFKNRKETLYECTKLTWWGFLVLRFMALELQLPYPGFFCQDHMCNSVCHCLNYNKLTHTAWFKTIFWNTWYAVICTSPWRFSNPTHLPEKGSKMFFYILNKYHLLVLFLQYHLSFEVLMTSFTKFVPF
jgi:hypothetical protein